MKWLLLVLWYSFWWFAAIICVHHHTQGPGIGIWDLVYLVLTGITVINIKDWSKEWGATIRGWAEKLGVIK